MATKTPTYREAYPRLDIRDIQAAARENRLACRYTDQVGRELGQAFILDLPEGAMLLGFSLAAPYLVYKATEVSLTTEHAPDPVNYWRHFFRCPGCDQHKKVLFYKGSWSCAECHRLGFRSQLLRSDVRYDEWAVARREELQALLANGRPHRMRHATFEERQSELETLDDELANSPRKVASAEHRHIVTGIWMEPKDLPNGLFHDGFYILGNAIEKQDWYRLHPWPSGE